MTLRRARTSLPLPLDAAAVTARLPPAAALAAAEHAFRLYRPGAGQPAPLAIALRRGGAHVKAALLPPRGELLVVKINANLPGNPRRHGLPTIQGLALAFDGLRGTPLAVLDSAALTARRTAAATALAARHLAAPDADQLAVIGCGTQGYAHVEMLAHVLELRAIRLFDRDRAAAQRLARALRGRYAAEVRVAASVPAATRDSHVVICCTTARRPFLRSTHLAPGAFVAAVGADHPDKRELTDEVLARALLVVDSREQAAAMGEWHHAAAAGGTTNPPELGEIVRGTRRGRTRSDQLVVFDSTGFGLQDCCAVAAILQRQGARA